MTSNPMYVDLGSYTVKYGNKEVGKLPTYYGVETV